MSDLALCVLVWGVALLATVNTVLTARMLVSVIRERF
jgi:hypothetical protein